MAIIARWHTGNRMTSQNTALEFERVTIKGLPHEFYLPETLPHALSFLCDYWRIATTVDVMEVEKFLWTLQGHICDGVD